MCVKCVQVPALADIAPYTMAVDAIMHACYYTGTISHYVRVLVQEENYGSIFMALDKFFLTVFIMEILIKWYHDFFGFWKVNWNIFDFIIVAASLLGPSK